MGTLNSKLTYKQERFVEEYLVDNNATKAAERAGYSSPSYGRRLYTKPHVREAIASARKQVQERTQITQDMVAEGLLEEATRDDEDGGNTNARIQAWKTLGKHLGMFVDRVEESSSQTIEVIYTEE